MRRPRPNRALLPELMEDPSELHELFAGRVQPTCFNRYEVDDTRVEHQCCEAGATRSHYRLLEVDKSAFALEEKTRKQKKTKLGKPKRLVVKRRTREEALYDRILRYHNVSGPGLSRNSEFFSSMDPELLGPMTHLPSVLSMVVALKYGYDGHAARSYAEVGAELSISEEGARHFFDVARACMRALMAQYYVLDSFLDEELDVWTFPVTTHDPDMFFRQYKIGDNNGC